MPVLSPGDEVPVIHDQPASDLYARRLVTQDSSAQRAADFSAFFRLEYPRIVREIDLVIGDRDAAAQVAQEAFTRMYVHWSKVSKYDKPGCWVRRVAIRLGARWHKSWILPVAVIDREPPSQGPPVDLVLDVRQALECLSRYQRAAVVLHYFRDLPVQDVARSLGCKEATAKVHLHRARERLRLELSAYDPNS